MVQHILDKILDEQDRDFIRVLEDLIEVLIAQKVITLEMLPSEAARKFAMRRQMRHAPPAG
ncbi:hypothetical protein [Iodidimonas sp. SYSU 1G8]|uniref:hypothetical protein n=1 Tax=Iodidimonas sp. SYSU 1G8 TaxID=3133967 RepID=UPI0031FEE96C